MRVLILGAAGMLGHELLQAWHGQYELAITGRGVLPKSLLAYAKGCKLYPVDAADVDSVAHAVGDFKPQVVVNCIGIIKQKEAAKNAEISIAVNSLFPHQLHRLCRENNARLIHLSTDCVFSGRKGAPYTEEDIPDPTDMYGRSKLLGEISGEGAVTLRTSIIGREIGTQLSFLEWAISQRGKAVKGYVNALYTGLTTREMARVIQMVFKKHPNLTGIYHVAAAAISKYDLLVLINRYFNLALSLEKEENFQMDRRLDARIFNQLTGYTPPSWQQMIEELV